MIIKNIGLGMPYIGLVGCLHGNEKLGKRVIERFNGLNLDHGKIKLIIANEKAIGLNKRFVDEDINRCFPGNTDTHEGRLAQRLYDELRQCDYVLDIHTTTSKTANFIIITSKDAKDIIQGIPLEKVVMMDKCIANGGSLIDHMACGASIEFDSRTSAEYASDVVMNCLRYLDVVKGIPARRKKQYFRAYGKLKNEYGSMTNFKMSNTPEGSFYPLFYGDKELKDFVCLKAEMSSFGRLIQAD